MPTQDQLTKLRAHLKELEDFRLTFTSKIVDATKNPSQANLMAIFLRFVNEGIEHETMISQEGKSLLRAYDIRLTNLYDTFAKIDPEKTAFQKKPSYRVVATHKTELEATFPKLYAQEQREKAGNASDHPSLEKMMHTLSKGDPTSLATIKKEYAGWKGVTHGEYEDDFEEDRKQDASMVRVSEQQGKPLTKASTPKISATTKSLSTRKSEPMTESLAEFVLQEEIAEREAAAEAERLKQMSTATHHHKSPAGTVDFPPTSPVLHRMTPKKTPGAHNRLLTEEQFRAEKEGAMLRGGDPAKGSGKK